MRILLFKVSCIGLLLLCGCQSTHTRNIELVQDRMVKLKGLSDWRPTWCRVESELTQPAIARARQMNPQDLKLAQSEVLSETFTWKARETTCELTPLQTGALTDQQTSLLKPVFCTLLQVFFVNSPFDGLKLTADDIEDSGDRVRLKTEELAEPSTVGVYLSKAVHEVETRTRGGRLLRARYGLVGSAWLPLRLEQEWQGTQMVIDEIEYAEVPLQGRRLPQSFWLLVGQGQNLIRQSKITLTQCQPW